MPAIDRRPLGKNGVEVPALGLGAMDTPTSEDGLATVLAAHELGVRFVDTAREYAGSEALLGKARREHGADGFYVCSKTFSRSVHGSQYDVDRSLSVLGVEQIGMYMLHDVSTRQAWAEVMGEEGALEGLKTAQYRGLIGQIGVSSHDLGVVRLAIESGEFDAVMLEYSAFAPESRPLIELAAEREVGVVVMRPLGGSGRTTTMRGDIEKGYEGPLTPANLLRYVLSTPGVTVAIPGARHPDRIEANVETALGDLAMGQGERRELEAAAGELY